MLKTTTANRIPSLDGLRALSIFMVLIGHGSIGLDEHSPVSTQVLLFFFGQGSLGVSIFFCISGFIITHLLLREQTAQGRISLGAFYLRRVRRILPACYTYLATVALLVAWGVISVPHRDLLSAALFFWNYDLYGTSWYLGHFWSLCLEEQFYMFWPLVLVLVGRRHSARVALALIVLMPAMRVLTYYSWPEARGHVGMMLHTASDSLMYGCLIAIWQGMEKFQLIAARLDSAWVPMLAVTGLMFSQLFTEHFRGAYEITVGKSLNSLLIAILMLWSIRHPLSLWGRILNAPLVVHLGVISYSLYLWQQLMLGDAEHALGGIFPLGIIAALAAAELSYWCVERPCMRLGKLHPKP